LARRADLFDKAVAYVRDNVTITGAGEPTQAIVSRASAGLFSMLGAHARIGRALVERDDDPSNPNVAVLSDRFWRLLNGGNPDIVGRVIQLSGEPYIVVGVMPREFEFQYSNIDLWIPIRLTPAFNGPWLEVTARLKPGISMAQAHNALEIAARQFEREDPKAKPGLRITVSPWQETPTREYELTLVFILVAVGLVLMIACVNVASLLLSRAVQRQKEMAIRASLGAGRWQVVRQLLAESSVLALAGSAAGIAIARYALAYLVKQLVRLPIPLPHLQSIALDERVLLFK
jgi:putative ABC transport system permease protein